MQLPVDIRKLLDEAADIDVRRAAPISISMYIDPSAPADVIAHVRSAFMTACPNVRLTIEYIDDAGIRPSMNDDMAILIAGLSEHIGYTVKILHKYGIPVMVTTTLPQLVEDIASATHCPISAEDIISCVPRKDQPVGPKAVAADVARKTVEIIQKASDPVSTVIPPARIVFDVVDAVYDVCEKYQEGTIDVNEAVEEPYFLTDENRKVLDNRMGAWITEVCGDKRLAFSNAFPFVRQSLAYEAIRATAAQNAGIGLLPFIPGADMPIMTLNQAKMVLQIAAAYGYTMDIQRAKEIAAVSGGAFVFRSIAHELVELIPFLGGILQAGVAYTGTSAMGHAVVVYYENGETAQNISRMITPAAKTGAKVAEDVLGKVIPASAGILTKATKRN